MPICGGSGINDAYNEANKHGYTLLQGYCAGREDFKIAIADQYAALQKKPENDTSNLAIPGNFGKLMSLKKSYPDLKVIASVGGWTLSDPFHHFDDPKKRNTFVTSVKEFLTQWKFFDGVDIDWEYPGGQGANPRSGKPEDKNTYTQLMIDLREMLDTLSSETGKDYQLSSAIGSVEEKLKFVDLQAVQPHVHHFNVMTFDYHGAFDLNDLGYLSPLHPSQQKPNDTWTTDASVKYVIENGVPPEKIAIGTPMYGRGWTGVQGSRDNPFDGTASGPVKAKWQNGVVDYKVLAGYETNGEWEKRYDDIAEAPYLYKPDSGELITYDDARSIKAKMNYILEHNLGGVFSWEIDGDNGDLLNATMEGLGFKPKPKPKPPRLKRHTKQARQSLQ